MIYTYNCAVHGDVEADQRMTDNALTVCPEKGCRKKAARVITGGNGFELKGGGWFKDGYSGGGNDRRKFDEVTSK